MKAQQKLWCYCDPLAHCIDTALWLNGGIESVVAMTETFIKERRDAATGTMQPVSIDDARTFWLILVPTGRQHLVP